MSSGRIVRRHIDHILLHPQRSAAPDWLSLPDNSTPNNDSTNDTTMPPPPRQSTRVSVPPDRYGYENSET